MTDAPNNQFPVSVRLFLGKNFLWESPFLPLSGHSHKLLPDWLHRKLSHFLPRFPAQRFHVHCNPQMEQGACPGFLQVQAPHLFLLSYILFLSHIPAVVFPGYSGPTAAKSCCFHLHFWNPCDNNQLRNRLYLSEFLFLSARLCQSALFGYSWHPLPETIQNTTVLASP